MVTQHFKDRVKQRTKIKNIDSFIDEVLSVRDEVEKLNIFSSNLSKHPQVKYKIWKNPNQRVWVIDWLGFYIIEQNQKFITMFPIQKNYDDRISGENRLLY